MASKKKQPEGIALLSMYNDEEDDDMEDVEENLAASGQEGEQQGDDRDARAGEGDLMLETNSMVVSDSAALFTPPLANYVMTPEKTKFRSSTPQQPSVIASVSPQERLPVSSDYRRIRREALTIVDYGHDEVAMSPEPEEGEFDDSGQVTFGEDRQRANGDSLGGTPSGTVPISTSDNDASGPQFSEPLKSDAMNHDAMVGSDNSEHGGAIQEERKFDDPLDKFLPPPSKAKCSQELHRKINKFLHYKKAGKSFNAEVRNRKDYRNPDFLLHAVRYQGIDQIGSCFYKDVFDPHGYDPSDFIDQIEADMRRESERREREKKKAQKVDFVPGGTQGVTVAGVPRINLPLPGDAINRDGRQNKKSKWGKVDGDQNNPLLSVGQDSVSTVGAHAAILSAANAGGGYMRYAQQKRREAEGKRSSERKSEIRS